MEAQKPHRGYLTTTLNCRCPRCREGKLFKHRPTFRFKKNMQMFRACEVCGQPTEIEVGFYYGTSYVSYAITVFFSLVSLAIWAFTIGISVNDNRFFIWLIVNAVVLIALQPWLMRLSRSLWISWFVRYDADWKNHRPEDYSERLNADQENNW